MLSLILGAVVAVASVVSVILRKKNEKAADTIDGIIAVLKRLIDVLGAVPGLAKTADGVGVIADIKNTVAKLEENPHDSAALAEANILIGKYERLL